MMYAYSLKRVFCIITVPRLVTYQCGTLTGCPVTLHPTCRQFRRIQFTQKTEARLKSIDKIPNEYTLIYRAPLTSYMTMAQITSSISILSLGVVGAYKYLLNTTINFPLTFGMSEFSEIKVDVELFIMVSAFILFNVGVFAITLKYPLRIYHHEGTSSYIGVLKGLLPFNTYHKSFCAGEVRRHISFIHSLLPWRNALFKVGKKTTFIMENYFRTPSDFNIMLNEV